MTCRACPFAFTNESESIQNLGCLPSPYEIMVLRRETGRSWSCHEDDTKPCAGQIKFCREEGFDHKVIKPLITYTKWYHDGVADLLEEATQRILD